MTKSEFFAKVDSTWLSAKRKQELKAAVEEYSSALIAAKPLVSGSLPRKCTCERCTGIKLESYYKDDDDGNDH